jgi:RimJ/RimL family protein N-acetyltransferase
MAGLDEIVSFTAVTNARSIAVMERLGMTRIREFQHPQLPDGHPLRQHVLYHQPAASWDRKASKRRHSDSSS